MKETEDKQCIKLVFITRMYRDAWSTKHKNYKNTKILIGGGGGTHLFWIFYTVLRI